MYLSLIPTTIIDLSISNKTCFKLLYSISNNIHVNEKDNTSDLINLMVAKVTSPKKLIIKGIFHKKTIRRRRKAN